MKSDKPLPNDTLLNLIRRDLAEPVLDEKDPDLMSYTERQFSEIVFGMSLHNVRPVFLKISEILKAAAPSSNGAAISFDGFKVHIEELEKPNSETETGIVVIANGGCEYKVGIGRQVTDDNQITETISISVPKEYYPGEKSWLKFARCTSRQRNQEYDDPKMEEALGGCQPNAFIPSDRWGLMFEFLDFARNIRLKGVAKPSRVGKAHFDFTKNMLKADGWIAGDTCKAVARELRTGISKRIAPWTADAAIKLNAILRENALNHNESCFLHNDLDNHSFRIPLKPGRVGLYHFNSSLFNEHRGCLFVVEQDEQGHPTSINVRAIKDSENHRGKIEELIEADGELGNPNFKMNLKTGEVKTSEHLDTANIADLMVHGLGFDLERAEEYLKEGADKERWISDRFDFLDPAEEFEEETGMAP